MVAATTAKMMASAHSLPFDFFFFGLVSLLFGLASVRYCQNFQFISVYLLKLKMSAIL